MSYWDKRKARAVEELRRKIDDDLAKEIFNAADPAPGTLTRRMIQDTVDKMNGVYRPSPVADEAERGTVIEGTYRQKTRK